MNRTATDETQEALEAYIARALKYLGEDTGVLRGPGGGPGAGLFTWTSSTARQLHGSGNRWWGMHHLSFDISMACAALSMVHIDLAREQLSKRQTSENKSKKQQLWLQRSSSAPAPPTERFVATRYTSSNVVEASKRLRQCAGVLDFMAQHGWPSHREHGKRLAPPDVAGEVVLGMRDMVLAAAQGCAAFKAASSGKSIGTIARLVAGMAQWFYKAYLRMGGVALDSGEGGLLVKLPRHCKPGALAGVEERASVGAADSDSDADAGLSPAGMYSEAWDAGWEWPLVKGDSAPPQTPSDASVAPSKQTVLQNINPSIRSHCGTSACLCRALAHKFHTLHLRAALSGGALPALQQSSTAAEAAAHAREAERWMCKTLHMYGERDTPDSTHPLVSELRSIQDMRAAAEEECLSVYSVMPLDRAPLVPPAYIMKPSPVAWDAPAGDTQWYLASNASSEPPPPDPAAMPGDALDASGAAEGTLHDSIVATQVTEAHATETTDSNHGTDAQPAGDSSTGIPAVPPTTDAQPAGDSSTGIAAVPPSTDAQPAGDSSTGIAAVPPSTDAPSSQEQSAPAPALDQQANDQCTKIHPDDEEDTDTEAHDGGFGFTLWSPPVGSASQEESTQGPSQQSRAGTPTELGMQPSAKRRAVPADSGTPEMFPVQPHSSAAGGAHSALETDIGTPSASGSHSQVQAELLDLAAAASGDGGSKKRPRSHSDETEPNV